MRPFTGSGAHFADQPTKPSRSSPTTPAARLLTPLSTPASTTELAAIGNWAGLLLPCLPVGTLPGREGRLDDQTVEMVEVLQAATRVLAGVALRSMDVLDGIVSLPQFRVLAVLAELEPARSTTVARALGLDASTITRLADRLVAAGHVVRGGDPGNRSVVTLELTPLGRNLVTQVTRWRRQELTRILGQLAPTDRVRLTASLRLLVEAAGAGYGAVTESPVPL